MLLFISSPLAESIEQGILQFVTFLLDGVQIESYPTALFSDSRIAF